MISYIVERVVYSVLLLFMVSTIMFFSMRALPGGPLDAMLADDVSDEIKARMAAELGLDKPLTVQYSLYLQRLAVGDLGNSIRSGGTPVSSLLAQRFPATIQLALISVLASTFVGIVIGVISALKPGSKFDHVSMLLALLGRAVPQFWLALLLILLFSIKLQWLPAGGRGEWYHIILPSVTSAAGGAALIARLVRSSMLDVVHRDYIWTARAKGLPEFVIVYRHMLRNALIPVVTVIGLIFGFTLGGSVIVESIFAWPGMGRLIVESIFLRDYPVVQGGILVFALCFAVVNFMADISYVFLDPRLHTK